MAKGKGSGSRGSSNKGSGSGSSGSSNKSSGSSSSGSSNRGSSGSGSSNRNSGSGNNSNRSSSSGNNSNRQQAVQRSSNWRATIRKSGEGDNKVSQKAINKARSQGATQEQIDRMLDKRGYKTKQKSGSFVSNNSSSGGNQDFTTNNNSNNKGGNNGNYDAFNDLSDKDLNNDALQTMIAGSFFDQAQTDYNTDAAIRYNREMTSDAMRASEVQDERRAGYGMQFIAAEGARDRDLIGKQGEEQRAAIRTTGDEERTTLTHRTDQDLRLRADARGQIERQGKKFFA